jgi:hypothetical protein
MFVLWIVGQVVSCLRTSYSGLEVGVECSLLHEDMHIVGSCRATIG